MSGDVCSNPPFICNAIDIRTAFNINEYCVYIADEAQHFGALCRSHIHFQAGMMSFDDGTKRSDFKSVEKSPTQPIQGYLSHFRGYVVVGFSV